MTISKEIKIALATIIAAVIIYLGIIFLKGVSFSKSQNIFFVEMDDVNGLAEAAPVLANGVKIGIVNSVDFNSEKQNVIVGIELNEGVKIPNGSKATLSKEMLGAAKLRIILGEQSNGFMQINDTIRGSSNSDILSAAGELMPQVNTILQKVDSLLDNVNQLVANPALNNSLYNVQAITQNVENTSRGLPVVLGNVNGVVRGLSNVSDNFGRMSDGLNTTVDKVDQMVNDARAMVNNLKNASASVDNITGDMSRQMPQILNSANQIGMNLEETTNKFKQADVDVLIANLNTTIQNLNMLTENLDTILANQQSSLGKVLYDPELYNQLDSTLANASRLLEDLRNHPKRYVHFSLFGRKNK